MSAPNILILTTDQQRWDALGANGNSSIRTPNLDRLSASGTNFDHCFVQNPVCMPSRVSFLTGCYPSTLGITHMGVPVPPEAVTLPRLLRSSGYYSGCFGKLHFLPHANRDHREVHPDYGFDELQVSDEPGVYEDAYRAWVRRTDPEQLDFLSVGLPPARHDWQRIMNQPDGICHPSHEKRSDFEGAIPFRGKDSVTHSAFVADRTINFLQRQTRQPFLCVSGFYSPHAPWVVPQRFLDLYDPDAFDLLDHPDDLATLTEAEKSHLRAAWHGYYAAISEVDFHIGRILDELEAQNLLDSTIIVFTSDHGEWLGEQGRWGKGYPGTDSVARVPLLVHAPGTGGGRGTTSTGIVEALDVVPTLLELTGVQQAPHLQGGKLCRSPKGISV
ncbi:sulfatase family protein [Puniceicoccus vermicola]|uniref:Sulfatase-like hydrolase/transferase n=1 Tax=Puniceicoccus vermicola TaxID=388746 RepID=A0A7X1E4V3_9BACT|nr:sulfatase-like hydrolase/transferase [Puniceicoccus vermicola]MBC2602930.1 sulfatase-like hydrolase/transferase [Puniceicoccus vermicola]